MALLRPGQPPPGWSLVQDTAGVCRLIRKLEREAEGARCCRYEAGPTGFVLQRQLTRAGIDFRGVAASLIPVQPGARIKTDRRHARKLAELHRAGLLTEVKPPTEDEEAVRDHARRIPTAGHLIS